MLGTENELLEKGYLIDVPSSSTVERHLNWDMSKDEFVKRVDQFVKNFRGTKIDSFLVNFYLKREQSNTINQWLSFAIARGVQRIDLLLQGKPYYANDTTQLKCYKFDFGLFLETNVSTLKHLCLQHCVVFPPTNRDFILPFKNLRYLSLESTEVDEMFIESILSNCLRLEEFCLCFCDLNSSSLKIVSSSLCYLKFIGCYDLSSRIFGIEVVKVQRYVNLILLDCLKLISLEYDGEGLDTLNINTPLLQRIEVSIFSQEDLNAFAALCGTFPELEIMHVTTLSMVATSLEINQPLKHLKELNFVK
ncbi:uncharacterized protein [Cicer arietinum]|uniref:Uncharacterized protein LOC101511212 n=1 Tax=Cicer arietinum TaxID=3827 RepID=A0A1S3E2F8_CICAR|nr:uncharacterized protein LOC101511212 [Cicer arietinum]XP_027188607.1 uncharacterized protein LOC101511212 [Cicer arietinum]